jgi:hypothetical protein
VEAVSGSPAAEGRLRGLPVGARIGLSALVLVLAGGFVASFAYLHAHYQNRDERPGLTLDDLESAYHGLDRPSPLLSALERGHPEGLDPEAKRILGEWLRGGRIAEAYDDLDLGDYAPAELIASHCLSCHSRRSDLPEGTRARLPLDTFDDVKAIAFSQRVSPVPREVLAASTHAHALSLATLSLAVAALAWLTSWPRGPLSFGIGATGVALLADIGGWWLAREAAGWSGLVAAAGAVYNVGTALLLLAILIDLWRPRRGGRGEAVSDRP